MDDHRYGANSEAGVRTTTASAAAAAAAAPTASTPAQKVTELATPRDGHPTNPTRPALKGTSLNFFLEKEYFINGSYCCPVCRLKVATKQLLEHHVDAHEVTLNIDGTKHVYRQFVRMGEGREPSLPPSCQVCKKNFSNKKSLKAHMEREHDEEARQRKRPFFCEVCQKTLLPTTNMKRHMLTHTDTKPFSCTLCDKTFKSAFSLKGHLLVHSGARPFKCKICGEAFRSQSILTVHTRRHTNETPYSCPDCNKKFKDGGAFRRHRFTHDSVKPFQCKLCPKGYTTAQSLKTHEASHAAGEVRARKRRPIEQQNKGTSSGPDDKRPKTVTPVITVISSPGRQMREAQDQVSSGQVRKQTFISLLSNERVSVLGEAVSSINESQDDSHGRDNNVSEGLDFPDEDGIGDGPIVEVSTPSGTLSASSQVATTLLSASLCSSASLSSAETSAAVASINSLVSQASTVVAIPAEQQGTAVVDGTIAAVQDGEKEGNSFQCQLCEKSFPLMQLLSSHLQVHVGVGATRCAKCRRVVYDGDLHCHPCSTDLPKPHVCPSCHRMFSDAAKYNRHVVSCSRERHFQCNQCRRRFATNSALESHKLTHSEDKQYQCSDCKKRFARLQDLKIHIPVHSQGKRFGCPYCEKRCRTKTQLNSHLKCHTNERNYCCPHCSKTFARSNEFNVHMRGHTGVRPFSCRLCSSRFTTGYALHLHSLTHSSEHSFKCSQCSMAYKSARSLKRHILSHSKVPCYQCSLCKKRFATKSGLNAHTTTHLTEAEKPFQCQNCGQGFLQEKLLRKHEAVHLPGDTRFACPVCQKDFGTEVGCKNHMKIHTNGEFPCLVCDSVFHTRSALHRHEVANHQSSFKCDMCERVFRTARWLKSHVCGPPGKTPYLCPHCPNTYSSAKFLEKHVQRHLDRKESIPCPICQKSFPTEFGLDNHLETHSEQELEKVYICSCFQCGKKFRNVASLDRHVKFCSGSSEEQRTEERQSNRTPVETSGTEELGSSVGPDTTGNDGEPASEQDAPARPIAPSPREKNSGSEGGRKKVDVDVQTDALSEEPAEKEEEEDASVPSQSVEEVALDSQDRNPEEPATSDAGVTEESIGHVKESHDACGVTPRMKENPMGEVTASFVRAEIQGTVTSGGGGHQADPPDSQSHLQSPELTPMASSQEAPVESSPQGPAGQDGIVLSEGPEYAADGEAPTQYQCTSCLGVFPSAEAILDHVPQCTCYQCESCGNVFSSAAAVLEHVPTCATSVVLQDTDSMTASPASPAAIFKCPQCVEAFSSKSACLDHIQIHSTEYQTSGMLSSSVTPPVQLVLKKHVDSIRVLTSSVTEEPFAPSPVVTPDSTLTSIGANVTILASEDGVGCSPVLYSDSPLSPAQMELLLQIDKFLAGQALVGKSVSSPSGMSQDIFLGPTATSSSTPVQLLTPKSTHDVQSRFSPSKKQATNQPIEKPSQPILVDAGFEVEITQQPGSVTSPGSNSSSAPMKALLGTGTVHLNPPSPRIWRRKKTKPSQSKSASVNVASSAAPQKVQPKPQPQSLLSFVCTECQEVFPTLSTMVSHKSLAHTAKPPVPPPVFPCLICHKEFSSEEDLNDANSHNCALVRQMSGLPVNLVSGKTMRTESWRSRGKKQRQSDLRSVLVSAPVSAQPPTARGPMQQEPQPPTARSPTPYGPQPPTP